MYEGKLNRAKIVQISCNHLGSLEATLFFVDFGQRLSIPFTELHVLPEKLLAIAPFQAILCQLVGLKPADNEPEWTETACNRIFEEVLDVAEHVYVKCTQRLASNSKYTDADAFSVLAIDTGGEIDVNLNRRCVELGLAEYDEKMEHFLDPFEVCCVWEKII